MKLAIALSLLCFFYLLTLSLCKAAKTSEIHDEVHDNDPEIK